MTNIEKQALELVNEVFQERDLSLDSYLNRTSNSYHEALCRAIERHEALKREVSDAVEDLRREWPEVRSHIVSRLSVFIIAKPDEATAGLALAVEETLELVIGDEDAKRLRAAIEARGGRIVWEGE